ncbi:MAG: hypothetical protein JWM09_1572 [Francisellaceae bacterium]|nr:hypothetical protein [Francisellaceae bacterium]
MCPLDNDSLQNLNNPSQTNATPVPLINTPRRDAMGSNELRRYITNQSIIQVTNCLEQAQLTESSIIRSDTKAPTSIPTSISRP